jgi:hypothetical protein
MFGQAPTPPPTAAAPNPNEITVKIQQLAPETPKPAIVEQANEWVDFGRHVGQAMSEGLSALTKEANTFSGTPAGHFTMAVIAWKVAGHDAMDLLNRTVHVIVGVPFLIAWIILGVWVIRRNFMARRVVVEDSGSWLRGTRVRKYAIVNDESFSDGKSGTMWGTIGIFCIGIIWLMAGVIL